MNLDVEPDTVVDPIFGYHGGVFFKIGDGLFSFQPEVKYVRKGMRLNDLNSDWYQQFNMNYIDVPLLLRIGVNLKVAEIYFNMGPYVSYAFSSKILQNNFDETQNAWVESDYDYKFDGFIEDRFDAGVVMGAGVRLLMIVLEVQYNTGLTHVGNTERFDSSNHKYLNVSLGVQF